MFISAALREVKKGCTTQGLFISVMSQVKPIAETLINVRQRMKWNLWIFFNGFWKVFAKKYIENTSWKVLAYGIYARVIDVSEIERVSAANE